MRDLLFELQELDLSMSLRRRGASKDLEACDVLEKKADVARKLIEQRREKAKKVRALAAKFETEIESLNEKSSALSKKKMAVQNLKQLEAMEREIDGIAQSIETKEEDLLARYEEVESLEKEIAAFQKKAEAMAAKIDEARQARVATGVTDEIDAASLRKRCNELASQIDPAVLKQYKALRRKLPGPVVYAVERAYCTGCGRDLPFYEYNKISQNRDTFYPCGGCGRLLIYDGP